MPILVSLQLALYALLWAISGIALKDERPAILQWVGYALASAASVLTLVSAAVFNFLFLFWVGLRMHQDLQRQASHDATTGLPNRRSVEQRLQLEWDRSVRYGKPFVVISADVDHFKRINDQHGHAVGDAALIAVATALQNRARESDRRGDCAEGQLRRVGLARIRPAQRRRLAPRRHRHVRCQTPGPQLRRAAVAMTHDCSVHQQLIEPT